MEAAARTRRTRFGAFEVDLRSGEVYKHGIRLKLQDQPFQVLAFLLEHSGDVVTRDELRQKLWPADTFLDFDNGLNSAIKKLRDVLGDSAEEPRYIETLPRRGYRFIAAVDLPAAGSAQPAAAGAERLLSQPGATDVAPWALSSGRLRNALLTAVAATLVVALVVAFNVGGVRTRFLGKPGPARIESIAVLPLVNLSADSEQEYFAAGVTEALITDLGKISALRVISHTSVMQYKDTKKPLPEIARELKVDVLVEGMVARSGDRVRITANLVQASPEKHLWADSYERNLGDILMLQDDVARAIANGIQIKLTPQEQARLASARPVNPEAHEAYLRALYSFYQGRNQGDSQLYNRYFSQSIEQYQEAVRLDPGYPQAYAGLARAYHWLASGLEVEQADLPTKSRQAAEKALALDERLAEAHAALGYVAFRFEWDFPRAEQEFRRAIELNPNYEEAHHGYGIYLSTVGRTTEAFSELNLVRELDPANLSIQETLAGVCTCAGQYDRAIGILQSLLATQPNAADFHEELVTAFIEEGEVAQGLEEARRAVQLAPYEPGKRATLVFAEAASGDRIAARKTLRELNELSRTKTVSPVLLAIAHAALGENDRAFELLRAAVARRDSDLSDLIYLKCDPMLRPLQADPRFRAVMRQTGLPE